jgi:hypothetical protein
MVPGVRCQDSGLRRWNLVHASRPVSVRSILLLPSCLCLGAQTGLFHEVSRLRFCVSVHIHLIVLDLITPVIFGDPRVVTGE